MKNLPSRLSPLKIEWGAERRGRSSREFHKLAFPIFSYLNAFAPTALLEVRHCSLGE